MPVNKCSKDGQPGFKWGDAGACYTYTSGNPESIKAAKKKALAQATAMGEFKMDKAEEMIDVYPAATQDIELNMHNRQYCIDVAGYGPMNPLIDNSQFWQDKADIFHTTIEEAKTARCNNCAAFIQTSDMREAMANGLGGEDITYAIIDLANLGYCEIFDFKCAGDRTCNAWVVGGPITDENDNVTKTMVNVRKIQYRDPLK